MECTLGPEDAHWIEKEFLIDYNYFGVIQWNNDLVRESIRLISKYRLRVLDAIQLSAALLAKASLFITSDKRLFAAAKKELPHAKYV